MKAGDKIEFRLQKGCPDGLPRGHRGRRANAEPPNQHEARIEHRARGDAASVTLIFDDAYVPDPDDRVLVQPYDEDGNALEGYIIDLPDVYDGREGPAQGQRTKPTTTPSPSCLVKAAAPASACASTSPKAAPILIHAKRTKRRSAGSHQQRRRHDLHLSIQHRFERRRPSSLSMVQTAKPRPTPVRRSSATAAAPSPKEPSTSTPPHRRPGAELHRHHHPGHSHGRLFLSDR